MTTEVPYVTIRDLDNVLSKNVEAARISPETAEFVMQISTEHVQTLLRKATENKAINILRQRCYDIAADISGRALNELCLKYGGIVEEYRAAKSAAISTRTAKEFARRSEFHQAVAILKGEAEEARTRRSLLPKDSPEAMAALVIERESSVRLQELKSELDRKVAEIYSAHATLVCELKDAFEREINELIGRRRALKDEQRRRRERIAAADTDELNNILSELLIEKGGEA